LAVAQRAVARFGAELRAAAKEAESTGDTSRVRDIAAQYEAARGEVQRLNAAFRQQKNIIGDTSHWNRANSAVQDLHGGFQRLGGSLTNMADNILPSWRLVFTVSIGAAVVALGQLAKSAAVSLDSLDDMAKATGTTTQQIEALRLVAIKAGDQGFEAIDKGLERTTKAMGEAQIEAEKLNNVISFSSGKRDFSDQFKALNIDVTRFKDSLALMEEFARKLDREPNLAIKAALGAMQWGKAWASVLPTMVNLRAETELAAKQIAALSGFTSQESIDAAGKFQAAWGGLVNLISRIRDAAGAQLGAALTPAINQLTAFIGANIQQISNFIKTAATYIRALSADLIRFFVLGQPGQDTEWGAAIINAILYLKNDLVPGLTTAFQTMMAVLNQIAAVFNSIFGTQATGGEVGLVIAIGLVTGAFTALTAALTLLATILTPLIAALGAGGSLIVGLGLAAAAVGAFAASWEPLRNAVNSVVTFIIDSIKTLIGWIQSAINALASLGSAKAAAPVAEAPIPQARGGYIPGTGNRDTVPAMLMPGEFVARKAAVNKYGAGLFQALNAGTLPRGFFRGFAAGGLVETPRGFADGGLVAAGAGGRPVNLHLGGKSFALSGSESVVGALVTAAHRHHMRAAGTKPSWYGGTPGR
jgi:hypothetical protein